jgi:chromosome segregation ATPase
MQNWNNYDTETEHELRQERNRAEDKLFAARRTITALRKYISELEKQLEPNVLAEIRGELDAQDEEVTNSPAPRPARSEPEIDDEVPF